MSKDIRLSVYLHGDADAALIKQLARVPGGRRRLDALRALIALGMQVELSEGDPKAFLAYSALPETDGAKAMVLQLRLDPRRDSTILEALTRRRSKSPLLVRLATKGLQRQLFLENQPAAEQSPGPSDPPDAQVQRDAISSMFAAFEEQ